MPFVAPRHEHLTGQVVGDSHCVALVHHAAGTPPTRDWRRGAKVQDLPDLAPGSAIATFDRNGRYANAVDGSSHAALFLRHEPNGAIRVFDQWRGRVAGKRLIRDKGGAPPACDDSSRYYIVVTA